jgi:hypothetical protein
MDLVTAILVPGFLGGLVVAAFYVIWQRRHGSTSSIAAYSRPEPLSIDAINFSSLRVAGVGGLGLVAMAAAVAIDVRRIGETIAIGFVCGVVIAAVLIVRRRRTGSMPSSGRGLGANTVLSIDAPAPGGPDRPRDPGTRQIDALLAPGH